MQASRAAEGCAARCGTQGTSRSVQPELGLDRLRTFLRRHGRIAVDTSLFIYQLETDARYIPLTDYIFRWLERPDSMAVTSTITMTELLVQPIVPLTNIAWMNSTACCLRIPICIGFPDPGDRRPCCALSRDASAQDAGRYRGSNRRLRRRERLDHERRSL
jgi:hypothetical protein